MTKPFSFEDFSFEISSPSALLLNSRIDDRAYRLFGVIKGLTRAHGYCYATNSYLANVLNTSEATIKRTIKTLKDEGFIEVQTDKTGIHWQRRIFLGAGLKKCLRRVTGELPPAHACTPPSSPVSHNKSIVNKTVVEEETPPNPPQGECVLHGKFVSLTKEELLVLKEQFGEAVVMEIIEEINDYLASTGKRPYKDYAATIRNWIRRRKSSSPSKKEIKRDAPIPEHNKTWWLSLSKILHPYTLQGNVYTGPDYAEFSVRGNKPERVYFRDDNFIDVSKNYLKKLEIFV